MCLYHMHQKTGKIEITLDKDGNPTGYKLNFKKADEFYFIDQPYGDYSSSGNLNDPSQNWSDASESCSC